MKIYRWPCGMECEEHELEEYLSYMSDDFEIIYVNENEQRNKNHLFSILFILLLISLFLWLSWPATSYGEEYNRTEHFGSGWIDADKDCQDTRQEVLIEESLYPVLFDDTGCKVLAGYWKCQFTGKYFIDPSELDIDHRVPLKEAWVSGANKWNKEERVLYANDLSNTEHLIAVAAGANRSKGAKDPALWLPVINRCKYVNEWISVKQRYNLFFDAAEVKAIVDFKNCYN